MTAPDPSAVVRSDGSYTLDVAHGTALAEFIAHGRTMLFVHTEVPPADRGQGVADALIHGALDDVRRRGETIVALCPYVAAYVIRHPEVQDLVVDR